MISDFDMTLTRFAHNGKRCPTCHSKFTDMLRFEVVIRVKVGFWLKASWLSFCLCTLFADILDNSKLISSDCKEKVGMRLECRSGFSVGRAGAINTIFPTCKLQQRHHKYDAFHHHVRFLQMNCSLEMFNLKQ